MAAFVVKHTPKLVRDVLIASEQFIRRSLRRSTPAPSAGPAKSSSSQTMNSQVGGEAGHDLSEPAHAGTA
jgi:hypothetical protein